MEINNSVKSILKLKSIIVKDFSFQRELDIKDGVIPKISIEKEIKNVAEDSYVSLSVKMYAEDSFSLNLTVLGVFSVSDFEAGKLDVTKNILLEKNAVSILFPYVRSQITLLTAQPSFQSIILPPININALLDGESETMND